MAGLIGMIREGLFRRDETLVFLHTGGQPASFAYDSEQFAGLVRGSESGYS